MFAGFPKSMSLALVALGNWTAFRNEDYGLPEGLVFHPTSGLLDTVP